MHISSEHNNWNRSPLRLEDIIYLRYQVVAFDRSRAAHQSAPSRIERPIFHDISVRPVRVESRSFELSKLLRRLYFSINHLTLHLPNHDIHPPSTTPNTTLHTPHAQPPIMVSPPLLPSPPLPHHHHPQLTPPTPTQSTALKSIKSVMPLLDRILVQRMKADAKTAGGLFLPESAVKELNEAKVLAVGPGGLDRDGKRIAPSVAPGDRVLIPQVC